MQHKNSIHNISYKDDQTIKTLLNVNMYILKKCHDQYKNIK